MGGGERMSLERTFVLVGEQQVQAAMSVVSQNWSAMAQAGHPLALRLYEHKDKKSREQEERYHAMLGDIAKQCRHLNLSLDLDAWKRLCIDQFKRDTMEEPECCARYWARHQLNIIPSLDGSSIVVLGEQSRKFPMGVAVAFIEWLFAFGGDRGVQWSDPTVPPIEVYERA